MDDIQLGLKPSEVEVLLNIAARNKDLRYNNLLMLSPITLRFKLEHREGYDKIESLYWEQIRKDPNKLPNLSPFICSLLKTVDRLLSD